MPCACLSDPACFLPIPPPPAAAYTAVLGRRCLSQGCPRLPSPGACREEEDWAWVDEAEAEADETNIYNNWGALSDDGLEEVAV